MGNVKKSPRIIPTPVCEVDPRLEYSSSNIYDQGFNIDDANFRPVGMIMFDIPRHNRFNSASSQGGGTTHYDKTGS